MKRVLVAVIAVIMMVSVFSVCANATTKADLLKECDKSPIYHYFKVSIENAARTVDVTDEQADLILPYIQDIIVTVPEDLGASADKYTTEQRGRVVADINAICDILNLTYRTVKKTTGALHDDDYVIEIVNAEGEIVFQYDGDIKKTDSADNSYLYLCGAAALVALAAVAFVVSRKRGMAK